MNEQPSINFKKLLSVVIALVIVFLLWTVGLKLSRLGEVPVELNVAPKTAAVIVDGKQVRGSTIYISKGDHQIDAKLDGFDLYTKKHNVKGPQKIGVLLNPVSEKGYKYLEDHPEIQLEREAIGSASFYESADAVQKIHGDLIARLPYTDPLFYMSYGDSQRSSNKEGVALYISAYDVSARKLAIDTLRDWGYDPSDIEIVFSDFTSSFDAGDD